MTTWPADTGMTLYVSSGVTSPGQALLLAPSLSLFPSPSLFPGGASGPPVTVPAQGGRTFPADLGVTADV